MINMDWGTALRSEVEDSLTTSIEKKGILLACNTEQDTKRKQFSELGIHSWLIQQCHSIGVRTPTLVQENCIPAILTGKNCIGCSKTGSGKTLGFILPILQKLYEEPSSIFCVVVVPTRELGVQIEEQFSILGKPALLRTCLMVSGISTFIQDAQLKRKPHIVICTPGRIAQYIRSNKILLNRVQFMVLDEADKLLGGQFDSDLQLLFKSVPSEKQMLLFSATMANTLNQIKAAATKEFFVYEAKEEDLIPEEVDQYYLLCPFDAKDGYLVQLLVEFRKANESGSAIIFTDTCSRCQCLCVALNKVGFLCVALHAGLDQNERTLSLSKFRSNVVKVLVATSLVSRGLDLPAVSLVVNESVPSDWQEYVHRVGRTARAGRTGESVTIVSQRDISAIKKVERNINCKLKPYYKDIDNDVKEILLQVKVALREAQVEIEKKYGEEVKTNEQWKKDTKKNFAHTVTDSCNGDAIKRKSNLKKKSKRQK